MDLSDEQKQLVRGWVEEGVGLSDIQKRLLAEFEVSMTYMDVRFLVIDLGVDVHDKPEPRPAVPAGGAGDVPAAAPSPTDALGGSVSLEVDRITKPGSMVSGTVSFSDGTAASWMLDQAGRLALDAGDPAYRPSEEDLRAFQEELRGALEKKGF